MKTKYYLLVLLAFLSGCSNKTDSTTTTATATAHQYAYYNGSCFDYTSQVYVAASYCTTSSATTTTTSGYQLSNNGLCYSTATGLQVATGYCTSTASGYQLSNGFCYMTSTGQQVSLSYCSTTSTSTTGQCVGTYIYNAQYVQCSGSNCSGYTLIQASTGTAVYCQ